MTVLLFNIKETLVSAALWIVSGVYNVAGAAFSLFLELADGLIVEPSFYQKLISNSYVIIGIVMLFVVAFSLLQGMISDDDVKKSSSNMRKVVINLITSSVIVALLPTIFTFAYDFQRSILTHNVIGNYLGNNESGNISSGIYSIVNDVYVAFFSCDGDCENYEKIKSEVAETGVFSRYTELADDAASGDIDFNFLVSLIAGLILIYVGVSFCFDMGIRFVKLLFYQIIAPVPVFMRVVPEGKMSSVFNNWVKVTLACYFEVFVRVFAIFFGVFVCNALKNIEAFEKFNLFGKAFVLMGIVVFMKQLPKLVSDVTGIDTGGMKLGIRDKLKEGGAFAAGAAVGGAALGSFRVARGFKGNVIQRGADGNINVGKSLSNFGRATKGVLKSAAIGAYSGVRSQAGTFTEMKNDIVSSAEKGQSAQSKADTYYRAGGNSVIGGYKSQIMDQVDNVKEFLTGDEKAAYALSETYSDGISKVSKIKSSSSNNLDKFKKLSKETATSKYGEIFANKFYGEGGKDPVTGKSYWGVDKLERERQNIEIIRNSINDLTNHSGDIETSIEGVIKTVLDKDEAAYASLISRIQLKPTHEGDFELMINESKNLKNSDLHDKLLEIKADLDNGTIDYGVAYQLAVNESMRSTSKLAVKLTAVKEGLSNGSISIQDAYNNLDSDVSFLTEELQKRQYAYNTNETNLEKVYSQYIIDNYDKGTIDFKADATDAHLAIEDLRNFIKSNYGDVNYYYKNVVDSNGDVVRDASGNAVQEKHSFSYGDIDKLSYAELGSIKDTMTIERGKNAQKIARAQERKKMQDKK